MDIIQSVILGLVQGLTEFLPVSSSAHLILFPKFLDWVDPGLSFDVALHFGTLLAVVSYFWKDLMEIWDIFLQQVGFVTSKKDRKDKNKTAYNKKIVWLLVVATIPGVLAGYFLNDLAESGLRDPRIMVVTLILFGGLLYWSDKNSKQSRTLQKLNFKDVILIGLAQGLAIIPGTSRSGATITMGLLLGLSRTAAARFSFLMSVPIIFGAVLYKMPDLLNEGIGIYEVVGVIISAISGYIAIAALMKFVNKVSYKIFFWYRVALAILVFFFLIKL